MSRHDWTAFPDGPRGAAYSFFVTLLKTGDPATNASIEELAREILRLSEENVSERSRIRRELETLEDNPNIETSQDAIDRLRVSLDQAHTCSWRQDVDGNWHTDCGHIFCFDDDGPTRNGFKFCCYCGFDLKEEPHSEDSRMQDPDNPGTETQE